MQIQKVDANYVKAFFDGEGCIHKVSKDAESWVLVIGNTEFNLIKNISTFLKIKKIRHQVVIQKNKKYKDFMTILINNVCNIYKFYKIV